MWDLSSIHLQKIFFLRSIARCGRARRLRGAPCVPCRLLADHLPEESVELTFRTLFSGVYDGFQGVLSRYTWCSPREP